MVRSVWFDCGSWCCFQVLGAARAGGGEFPERVGQPLCQVHDFTGFEWLLWLLCMQMVDCGQCVFINDNFGQVSADAMSIDYVT